MNLRRDVFRAIADPTRGVILLLLAAQHNTPETSHSINTARPSVSKHLQALIKGELLKQEQHGR